MIKSKHTVLALLCCFGIIASFALHAEGMGFFKKIFDYFPGIGLYYCCLNNEIAVISG